VAVTPIKDYVEKIDTYFEMLKGKKPRIDLDWGLWSREMNLEIRDRINNRDPQTRQLSMVFNYWLTVSQLLDLEFRYRKGVFGKNKLKKKRQEVKLLRQAIFQEAI
jgi:hypothetical protein